MGVHLISLDINGSYEIVQRRLLLNIILTWFWLRNLLILIDEIQDVRSYEGRSNVGPLILEFNSLHVFLSRQ
jgi:hypothetical protein